MPKNEEYVSQSEFGRRMGRSQQAISKLVHAGKIPTVNRNGKALIPFQRAVMALQTNLDPSQERPADHAGPGGGSSYHELRRAQLALKVQEKRIDVAVKEGKLIDREMTLRRAYAFFRGVRDAILNFPARYAAVMAAELGVDAGKLQYALDRRLRDHLKDIADRKLDI